jgi:hypothetical protein
MSLAAPLVRFVRVLRAAGLPVGPDRLIAASRALELVGVEHRDDVYWTLASLLLSRHEQFELFDQAFRGFWEARASSSDALPDASARPRDDAEDDLARRVREALAAEAGIPELPDRVEIETEARVVHASAAERLQRADFATMSTDELDATRRLMARLRLPVREIRTRRRIASARGPHVDLRATLRAGLRGGADGIALRRATWRRRPPPLVVLCDISGSMQRYARMFLTFLHAITNDRDRVHVFLFGTRLTNVTRQLRHRDVDVALAAVAGVVADWSGGTRLGTSLAEFNVHWSRRVLGQNAAVLLITDGLDRDGVDVLDREADRLRKSCRRLLWLNPLLRFDGFEPKAAGIRTLLPYVDAFLPAHNLAGLEDLARVLATEHCAVNRTRKTPEWK